MANNVDRFGKVSRTLGAVTIAMAGLFTSASSAQVSDNTLDALSDTQEIPVNIGNFVRAASDVELAKYVSLAGGVNTFYHFRAPTPVDNQPTIRMNRDTLYSTAVVDISAGATLTLPDVGKRYMTAMIVNQDHFINEVFSGGGTYTLDMETFDTPYVIVFMRTLVDSADPEDVAAVNAIQDQMTIKAGSADPFILLPYDEDDIAGIISVVLTMGPYATDSTRSFGSRDEVDSFKHFLGTAFGWGGLPESEAYYISDEPLLPVGEYKIDVPADVPVRAFWSISLYNAQGFFEPNDQNGYVVNSVTGTRNDDGTMTVHFGGCADGRVNCLPIMEGWNYVARMYQPDPEIVDGSWTFPTVQPLN